MVGKVEFCGPFIAPFSRANHRLGRSPSSCSSRSERWSCIHVSLSSSPFGLRVKEERKLPHTPYVFPPALFPRRRYHHTSPPRKKFSSSLLAGRVFHPPPKILLFLGVRVLRILCLSFFWCEVLFLGNFSGLYATRKTRSAASVSFQLSLPPCCEVLTPAVMAAEFSHEIVFLRWETGGGAFFAFPPENSGRTVGNAV